MRQKIKKGIAGITAVGCILSLCLLGGCQGEIFKNDSFMQPYSKENIIDIDEKLEQSGLRFENLSVSKSKSLPRNVSAEEIDYFNDTADEKGSLTGAVSYIFIAMDVTNLHQKETTVSWRNIFFTLLDAYCTPVSSDEIMTSWETRYRSKPGEKKNIKDEYIDTLKPAQTENITLGFIIEDKYAYADNFYFAPAVCGTTEVIENKDMKLFKI